MAGIGHQHQLAVRQLTHEPLPELGGSGRVGRAENHAYRLPHLGEIRALHREPRSPSVSGPYGPNHVALVTHRGRAARKAHPAFVVADLDAMRRRLTDAGAEIVEDDSMRVRRCYTADPFGNRIELVAAGDRGFTTRGVSGGGANR